MIGKPRPSPVANYCFTLNNWTDEDKEHIASFAYTYCRGLIYGEEIAPHTGTPHLQGYFQLIKKCRLTSLCKNLGDKYHYSAAKGTIEQNVEYCSKGGKVTKHGEFQKAGGSLVSIRQEVNKCTTYSEFLDCVDRLGSRHLKFAQECWFNKPVTPMEGVVLRDWQQYLFDKLQEPADDRTILWVYDEVGAKGKTFFSKYMLSNHGAFYTSPSKGADILYSYKNENIILYDIPRSCDEEYVNWGVIEKLKDGIIFSGKYASCTKVRKDNAHVCIFSNSLPEEGKFSVDRIKLIDLSKIDEILVKNVVVNVDEIPEAKPEAISEVIPEAIPEDNKEAIIDCSEGAIIDCTAQDKGKDDGQSETIAPLQGGAGSQPAGVSTAMSVRPSRPPRPRRGARMGRNATRQNYNPFKSDDEDGEDNGKK